MKMKKSKTIRYFEPQQQSSEDPETGKGIKVFEGALTNKKRKRTKHLVERKKHADNLKKMVQLSKDKGVHNFEYQPNPFLQKMKNKVAAKNTKNIRKKPEELKIEVDPEKLKKYSRGEGLEGIGIKTKIERVKLVQKEKKEQWAVEQTARTEILLTGDHGILEADEGEVTRQYRQEDIKKAVDITSATKSFELYLQFGPYKMNYTRNGRNLLLGGRRGHLAAFDWITKKLMFEINVMEEIADAKWLHNELMVATAQKEWVYIYDKQGVEIHCLKKLNRSMFLEFLPYHFLLSSVNENGWLSWLDVSIGKIVGDTSTHIGRPSSMVQNPYNAVICLGNSKGVVSMWSPTVRKPLAKMLCHKMAVQGLAVDNSGMYMATSSADHSLRIWDIRNLEGPVQQYKLRTAASHLAFSQKGFLATALGKTVEVFRDCCKETADKAYLRHCMTTYVAGLQFCPYEDVLGIGSSRGYSSILVPGCGEPNFDAYEANPFQTRKQRQESEVKSLLDKIQPDMICLDPSSLMEVDIPTMKDKLEAKKELLFLKAPKIDFTPRMKKKKHGNTVRMARSKKIVQAEAKREFVQNLKKAQEEMRNQDEIDESAPKNQHVLDRFRPKKTKKNKTVG